MIDVQDLRPTIVPKSDQLNSEQLLSGPITITVTGVQIGSSKEQPVTVHYDGEEGRPYKPCLTMRKVLILAWGPDGNAWVGKSMELYNDPAVRFGGETVGGIRIASMSDIPKDIKVSLTASKGKKAMHEIRRMQAPRKPGVVDHAAAINAASTPEALKGAFAAAYRSTKDATARAKFKAAYDARTAALAQPPATTTLLDEYRLQIDNATGIETAALALDEARDVLDAAHQAGRTAAANGDPKDAAPLVRFEIVAAWTAGWSEWHEENDAEIDGTAAA